MAPGWEVIRSSERNLERLEILKSLKDQMQTTILVKMPPLTKSNLVETISVAADWPPKEVIRSSKKETRNLERIFISPQSK